MTASTNRVRIAALCAAVLLGTAALLGCGGKDDDEEDRPKASRAAGAPKDAAAPASAAAAAPAGAAAGATGAASVTGKIVFEGAIPTPEKYKMTADAFCAKAHPGDVAKQDIEIGPDRIADVFVYVKSGISGTYPPTTAAVIDLEGCRYARTSSASWLARPSTSQRRPDAPQHPLAAEKNEAFNLDACRG